MDDRVLSAGEGRLRRKGYHGMYLVIVLRTLRHACEEHGGAHGVADVVEFAVTSRIQDIVNLRRNIAGAHLVPAAKTNQRRRIYIRVSVFVNTRVHGFRPFVISQFNSIVLTFHDWI